MSLRGKLEFSQEIKSTGNVFLEIYGSKKHGLPKICPDKVPVIELLEGNWGEVGCILYVHYLIEGKRITSKETVVAADTEKMLMTYEYLEGDFMKFYKSLKATFQITSKGEKNFMNWTIEYEKQDADFPGPDNMVGFATEITNMVDEHFVKNKSQHAQA